MEYINILPVCYFGMRACLSFKSETSFKYRFSNSIKSIIKLEYRCHMKTFTCNIFKQKFKPGIFPSKLARTRQKFFFSSFFVQFNVLFTDCSASLIAYKISFQWLPKNRFVLSNSDSFVLEADKEFLLSCEVKTNDFFFSKLNQGGINGIQFESLNNININS